MHGICVGCLHLDDFNHRVYIITVDFRAIEIDLQEAISRFLNVPGKNRADSQSPFLNVHGKFRDVSIKVT